MRSPGGAIVRGTAVTICSGNQYQGAGGNPGNQLQVGSAVFFKRAADSVWQTLPLLFRRVLGNDKYFAATLPAATFQTGDLVQYYLRIAYDDHDTTFLRAQGDASATTATEVAAQVAPFTFTVEDSAVKGLWGPVLPLPNVAIHAHVLPDGRVLMWGRRDGVGDSLDVQECTPFVWNPQTRASVATPQPKRADGTKVNLFCSGHSFLPDGRLLVVGGHLADGDGLSYAGLYDWKTNAWTASTPMTTPAGEDVRRWYPTATTLPDGTVLVASGSYRDPGLPPATNTIVVDLLQLWDNGAWKVIDKADGTPLNFIGLPLYPRFHVVSDGRVFMSGTNDRTLRLRTTAPGQWEEVGLRSLGNRDYCPAVMYDVDKIAYIGGGNEVDTRAPTAGVEIIDLAAPTPRWQRTGSMNYPRRQHNAMVLPDGSILVTGGTRGGGGPNNGFNDVADGQPVYAAEIWNPASRQWSELASEQVARCYHATAVLLPDATVLSAGGGEYRPDNINANDPEDSHRDAQVFSPPYLFKGPRPQIVSAPAAVDLGEVFRVTTPQAAQISKVSWVSLASVTHSLDENQRIVFPAFVRDASGLDVTAPASANVCPPGHYMMFVLNAAGVPSTAWMVRLRLPTRRVAMTASSGATETANIAGTRAIAAGRLHHYLRVRSRELEVAARAVGTRVVVGITGTCPYGIGACWGGAYEALRRLDDVHLVGPIPNADDSTAEVFLRDRRLPPLELWRQQFRHIVNGSYEFRGVEMTVNGTVERRGGELVLVSVAAEFALHLRGFAASDKLQWDHTARARKPASASELTAYEELCAAVRPGSAQLAVSITGPLLNADSEFAMRVRACEFVAG